MSWLGPVVGVVLGSSFVMGSVTSVAGQPASPETGTAAATACTVEPRSIDELLPIWFGPEGTPPPAATEMATAESEADLPQGSPADDATVAAINATVHEFFACLDAGQTLSALALASDDVIRIFGPNLSNPDEDTPEEVRAILEAQLAVTPAPGEATAEPTVVSDARDARILDDGRAGALFESEGDVVFIIFEKSGDRWLIDEFVDVVEQGAPAGATPVS
jgi:hypothetical protein